MKLQFRKCVKAERSSIPKLLQYFSENITPHLSGEHTAADCLLCLDEAATNIIMHGYKEEPGTYIELSIALLDDRIEIELSDTAQTFQPHCVPKPDVTKNLRGEQRGGFGVYLMKKLMDNFHYGNKNGKNSLSLVKYFPHSGNK